MKNLSNLAKIQDAYRIIVAEKDFTINEKVTSETDDIAFVIGKYMEVIEISTELTEEQKESIKCGLATGLYSSNYWEYKMQK